MAHRRDALDTVAGSMRRAVIALWIAAGAAILVAVIVLAGVVPSGRSGDHGGSAPSSAGGMTPVAAHAFTESIGVNVHLTYTTTPYGNFGRVLSSLRQLGV